MPQVHAEKRLSSSGTGLSSDKRRDASSICLGWKEKMMGNLIGRKGRVVKRKSFGGERS